MRLIKPDRGRVLRIHVQPDIYGARGARRPFEAPQQFSADAMPAPLRRNFDGLNIGHHPAGLLGPLDDGKARPCAPPPRQSRLRRWGSRQAPHHSAAQSAKAAKAHLFDRVERSEVIRYKAGIAQPHSTDSHKAKSHPQRRGWLSCTSDETRLNLTFASRSAITSKNR